MAEGVGQAAAGLSAHLHQAQEQLARIGGLEHWQVRRQVDQMRSEPAQLGHTQALEQQRHAEQLTQIRAAHDERLAAVQAEIVQAQQELVPFTDELVFQQAGVFRYQHVLENAEAYKTRLDLISTAMKQMIKDKSAVVADSDFTFNKSAAQGKKMVNDWCKVMLRAYNSEAENSLRVMKAGSVDAAMKRLDRTGEAIEKLGAMLNIRIATRYRALRMQELELTADYLQKKQEEKEAERAERERLREEAKAAKHAGEVLEYVTEPEALEYRQGSPVTLP
jgi:hypothetical protein